MGGVLATLISYVVYRISFKKKESAAVPSLDAVCTGGSVLFANITPPTTVPMKHAYNRQHQFAVVSRRREKMLELPVQKFLVTPIHHKPFKFDSIRLGDAQCIASMPASSRRSALSWVEPRTNGCHCLEPRPCSSCRQNQATVSWL